MINKITLELTAIFIVTHYWKINIKIPITKSILTHLPANNTTANLLTISISNSNLSAAATSNLSTTATTKLEIGDSSLPTDFQFISPTNRILSVEFGNWAHPKPEFPTLFKSSCYSKRCHIQQPGTQPIAATYQQHSTSNGH
ncbi:hypothetical protein G9A89_020000 [Geosiphon pyriformis]|nr:hypothetical protein G9A89_020000 [Geosiphon pyriformis]